MLGGEPGTVNEHVSGLTAGAGLQSLLRKEVEALSVSAMQQDGRVDAEALRKAEQLAQLVQLRTSLQPSKSRPRWPVVSILLITLTLLSVLLFARINETTIELNATLSEVAFDLQRAVLFIEQPLPVRALGVFGLDRLTLPRSNDGKSRHLSATAEISMLRLRPLEGDEQGGNLSLGAIALPAGTRVRLALSPGGRGMRIELAGEAPIKLQATAKGHIAMEGLDLQQRVFESNAPRLFEFEYRGGLSPLVLEIQFATGAAAVFSTQVPVEALSMSRIEDLPGTDQSIVRQLSTLQSGELYFEDLGGREKLLRHSEELRFESSQGSIRSISIEPQGIALQFRGSVTGMASGPLEQGRRLMPTWLEWIGAQHGLSLLWGGTLYVFGLVLTVVRWWCKT